MRPSPARAQAPEPDVWLPILGIAGDLEALDIMEELELFDLNVARADLAAELQELEADFWNTAPRRLEELVALVEPAPVVAPEPPEIAPVVAPEIAPAAPEIADRADPAEIPTPEPEPATETETDGTPWHRLTGSLTAVDVRTRIVGTVLVVAVLAAFAAVAPSLIGASVPQRDVTISIDGQTYHRTVRATTVGDVLADERVTLHPGDAVVPAVATDLHEGMRIVVNRAFPVDVDVNGVVTTVRTTHHGPGALRAQLGIGSDLAIFGKLRPLSAGSTIAFRTPHNVTLQVDGRTIAAPHSAALDVGALLAQYRVVLGPRDEVMPAPTTRLADGVNVRVFRLAEGEIAERVPVPSVTETRDDPSLPVGQTRIAQAGAPGVRRMLYREVKGADGTVDRRLIGSELLVPPTAQVVVRGTQPIPPRASGSATWYGTAPGRGTCAHLHLKFGTIVTLTNLATGASAQCRVADRGPEAWTGHIIDLAPDVFRRLAPLSQGVIPRLALAY